MNQIPKVKMMHTFLKRTALATVIGLFSIAAFALPSDRNQPITLLADRATFNERTGVTTYSGNVIIEQGTMKLQANSIVANLNNKRQISLITATGSPTQFQQKVDASKGLTKGQAQKIVYNAETGIITLSGNALLQQDGASIRGATLKYSMNKGDVEAIGTPNKTGSAEGRVKIVIPPSASQSFPGARD
ncbi:MULTISPECIES: lipopolysaccharide transport periplasmic protein LptA [Acinetobacter]|jgi:lipopolysaccharide export system protein LptA|uniref:Lipopolysaccharide export system protein LptA n=1 Tax=Acinetobacter pseudolwoffii TaxID=2053287 RepID=A0A2H9YRP2_9GAMM|nr:MULTISPECIES: lipopolysaccharide transport periplasmic protein LptA [Acinetobacter]ENW24189.1 lipopolysaccharide transport periplasmic protein LptA [Acinetobacter lwoffii NCTC 5866 = CIP 64.10 = NIPH 512]MCO8096081.1 lipopolysaccharide transport periplasmic protein LptA [Acinetobacter lwoffii]MCP0910646.1 lipopolysaccharide transport periplasmic protein LptA [Acinetobacter pseudolwoffii]MDM1335672.1 lipopolysaccharide transport periplasmic protein LptA [Acinetobacter pseudolwoffii]MDM133994